METQRNTTACGGGGGVSPYGMVFGFFEEGAAAASAQPTCRLASTECVDDVSDCEDEDEDGGGGGSTSAEEKRTFWAEQNQLLQAALSRSSSAERRIRLETETALMNARASGVICSCSTGRGGGGGGFCRSCVLREVAGRLREVGFDSAFCRSKWQKSLEIPSGEHSFVDVVIESTKGGIPARVVVEVDFRGEFEMARASSEYSGLVGRLPEVFVGKPEKLRSVIKIVCAAAKRCSKEKKIHLGPWRKLKYMQSKWLGASERVSAPPEMTIDLKESPSTTSPEALAVRQARRRASLLTFDLHHTAVAVV